MDRRGSVYSSASDYSSVVTSPVEDQKRFFPANGGDDDGFPKRSGVRKFVGQPTEDMLEVTIGETKYAVTKVRGVEDERPPSRDEKVASRPQTAENKQPESTVVFLGHGRGMSVGGVEVDFGPTVDLGGKLGPKEKNVQQQQVKRKPVGNDADVVGRRRRSIAWTPGMVNFAENGRNVENEVAVAPSATNTNANANANSTGSNSNKKEEEFDAQSYVSAQFELAQQTTDVMRNKLLNQHHQRSGSLGSAHFLSYFGRRKSKTPSDEGEHNAQSAGRPVHSRNNSVSGEQLRRASRQGSSGDLLNTSGNNSPLISRPASRSANKELAMTPRDRPPSQGNLLTRPVSRGPSTLLPQSLPLHSLPPPMVSPIPPSSYHPPQVTPTASTYHPPPHLSGGAGDHYSHHRQRERGASNGKLSAPEQEYIARTTGTPLLGQTWNSETSKIKKAPPHKTGLLGQMEKREKEKKEFKERTNRNSWTVQQAMRQRQSMMGMQQHAQHQALEAQQQQQQVAYAQQQQQQQQQAAYAQQQQQQQQQQYGFYGHQQQMQQLQLQQQQTQNATIAAWNAQQQQQIMIMQQQMALQAHQQQQFAERRGSWRYG
ncbi:hypothetical protein TWF481_004888 [Arthrobotrys musiformis]|uniref:Uncharacterized protein n=1 Tax=Arthrobotrys musiformis TaxID=47236 RepID=A0AAV9WMR1_9PEZI